MRDGLGCQVCLALDGEHIFDPRRNTLTSGLRSARLCAELRVFGAGATYRATRWRREPPRGASHAFNRASSVSISSEFKRGLLRDGPFPARRAPVLCTDPTTVAAARTDRHACTRP
jgi:hypothetical protein